MSTVGNVTLLAPNPGTSSNSTATNSISGLTQQDFLQLMVAQFQASDPLANGDSGSSDSSSGASDYVNQLMSMTNLTTLQTMSAQQGLQLAQTLPGDTVTITTPQNTTVSGVVTGTTISSTSGVNVTIDGQSYPSSEITALIPAAAGNGTATGTGTTGTSGTSGTTSN